jgi:molecular chaperone GrpE
MTHRDMAASPTGEASNPGDRATLGSEGVADDAVGPPDGPSEEQQADAVEEDLTELEAAVERDLNSGNLNSGDLSTMTRERDDFRAMVQRVQADFENYRKRVQREQSQLVERANERLLEDLLPVLDSFELAAKGIEADDADVERLRGGVLAAIRQLEDIAAKAGLEPVRDTGVAFDPTMHEAVMHDGDGSGEPHVGEVLRTGYRLKGRVLRPAMVRVTETGAE